MDANFIVSTHKKITEGAKTVKAIKDTITAGLASCDPTGVSQLTWIVDQAVGWVIGKLAGPHADAFLVSLLIMLEYAMRTKVTYYMYYY